VSLLLVRHGQASYGAADYDNLSERGHLQSRRLGDWLARGGHRFEAVVVGGMRRHRQTADGVIEAFAAQGLSLPEPVAEPGFAEFDHEAVFSTWLRRNADSPVAIASRSGLPRDVGAMLQAALLAWANDELPGLPESWTAFGERVHAAGERLDALAGGGEALVLSSGGVISRLAQIALDVPNHRAVELNLALRNSALSEFHPHAGRLRLGSWNALPHLHGARDLWTYY
jgi:broad specificity phosphatase PhoE